MLTSQLLGKFRLVSDQMSVARMAVVLGELEKVLDRNIPGDVVEFGCYIGTTSLFLRRMLNLHPNGAERGFHVYDSFAGLPEKSNQDISPVGEGFKEGELIASKKQLIKEFQKANLKTPIIHKCWFEQLRTADIPDKLAFAFTDGDFYESIITSLQLIWPRLQPGGVVTVDDYGREALPGASLATDRFFNKTAHKVRTINHVAIIQG